MSCNSSINDFTKTSPKHLSIATKKKNVLTEEVPTFQVYTDAELKLLEGKDTMSSAVEGRLVQSAVANMISSTQNLTSSRYPTFPEIEKMSTHLCEIYPALKRSESHVSMSLDFAQTSI